MALFKRKKSVDDKEAVAIAGRNTNYQEKFIKESQDEANNPVVSGESNIDQTLQRKKNETVQQYNERVPIAQQPVRPMSDTNYLGKKVQ